MLPVKKFLLIPVNTGKNFTGNFFSGIEITGEKFTAINCKALPAVPIHQSGLPVRILCTSRCHGAAE